MTTGCVWCNDTTTSAEQADDVLWLDGQGYHFGAYVCPNCDGQQTFHDHENDLWLN